MGEFTLAPRLQRPAFQNLRAILEVSLFSFPLDCERPLGLLVALFSRFLGTSCLNGQFSLLQPPLFH